MSKTGVDIRPPSRGRLHHGEVVVDSQAEGGGIREHDEAGEHEAGTGPQIKTATALARSLAVGLVGAQSAEGIAGRYPMACALSRP